MKEFEDAAKGVDYSKVETNKIVDQIDTLNNEIEELETKLEECYQEISRIAEEANRNLSPEEAFPGKTFEDIELIRREMRVFVKSVEEQANLALAAIRIFEKIEKSEEEKVKDIFGEGDLTSVYFQTITDGAYSSIEYEPSDGELYVLRSSGDRLRAYQLSTGTYDQLYLSTRLSLAQQILQDQRGFLLLDDPFLTSDSKRLPRQLEILEKLSEVGWQVIYFSVKDEIKSFLKNSIKNGRIDLKILPSIHE